MANEKRLRQIVDQIIQDPKSLNMSSWSKKTDCGTTYCIAGFAVHNSGATIDYYENGVAVSYFKDNTDTFSERAQWLLDLTDEEADLIFNGVYYCPVADTTVCDNEYCDFLHEDEDENDIDHKKATIRQVINNITKITGIEFDIPEEIR